MVELCALFCYCLLWLDHRCLEATDLCIWRMFVFMSGVVTVWDMWKCLLCSGRCKDSEFFQPWSVEVCILCASCYSFHATFCMICSLLMLVEDARGGHMDKSYSRAGLMAVL